MEKVRIEIYWWSFDKIKARANKYHWSIPFRYGEHTTKNHTTKSVGGVIIEENEKSYKVSLDYRKGFLTTETFSGFIAYIPKSAVVEIKEAQ